MSTQIDILWRKQRLICIQNFKDIHRNAPTRRRSRARNLIPTVIDLRVIPHNGGIVAQVFQRHSTIGSLERFDRVLGDRTRVEGVRALGRNGFERFRVPFPRDGIPELDALAVGRKVDGERGIINKEVFAVADRGIHVPDQVLADGEPIARGVYRRLYQHRPGERAVLAVKEFQAAEFTRDAAGGCQSSQLGCQSCRTLPAHQAWMRQSNY